MTRSPYRAVAGLWVKTPRLVVVAVGVWLVVAPALLDYTGRAEASDRTVGPIVAALSFVALWELGHALRWLTVPLGLWLVVAPLALWYAELAPTVNSILCGLLVVATAPPGRHGSRGFGGGWRTVVHPAASAGQARGD